MARRTEDLFEEEFEEVFAEEATEQDDIETDLENDGISPEEEAFMRGCKEAEEY